MNKSESIANLAAAMSNFQNEVKQPLKDANNPFFKSKFVPLENVVESISKTAGKHGLSFIQYPVSEDNKIGIVTLLMHSSGEYIETSPIYVTPKATDPQGAGSAITYLKRYSLSAVFGITSDRDDDGNAASLSQSNPIDLKAELVKHFNKTGEKPAEAYERVCKGLSINKSTKDLTEQETKAIISLLNKQ